MSKVKNGYGLMTTVSMIVGICIGSGIFFKADDILQMTGGSIFHGAILFLLGAVTIVFGGLTVGEMAKRTDRPGGVIAYGSEFIHPLFGNALGWFQVFMYYPAMIVVVASVIGIYANLLFGWGLTLLQEMLIGFLFMAFCFWYNTWHPQFGGFFQQFSTFIKLIPLILIAIFGLIKGNPFIEVPRTFFIPDRPDNWLSGIGAVAFSYDGWIVATSVSGDMKNPKRDLPRALIIGPVVILLIYLFYFLGISRYLGADSVTTQGDAHIYLAASRLFGRMGAAAVLIFVLISVMGTVNGMIMGMIRLPYSLALHKGMFPASRILIKRKGEKKVPVYAARFAFFICVFWFIVHFYLKSTGLLHNSDISEISIAMNYLFYVVLYGKVMVWYHRKKITSAIKGIFCPLMAMVGAGIVLYGSFLNGKFLFYLLFCLGIAGMSLLYSIFQRQG